MVAAPHRPLTHRPRSATMANMKVYLDGKFVDATDAHLSAFDASVQHGVGLFETMHAYHGRVFRLDQHIQRLVASATELGLTERLQPKPLAEAVQLAVRKNKLDEARIRLTITGGNLSLLAAARPNDKRDRQPFQPTILIHTTEPTTYPESFFADGVPAIIADPKANPFDPLAGHKTINYWQRLRTLTAAAAAKAGEALWFTITNHLASGSVSNVLLVKNEQLLTPFARGEEPDGSIPSPVLPGITRAAILELAEALSIPVQRRMLTINDVLEADELLLTNTSWLVLPVVQVERKTIASGEPGPITRQLHEQLMQTIQRECSEPQSAEESEKPQ